MHPAQGNQTARAISAPFVKHNIYLASMSVRGITQTLRTQLGLPKDIALRSHLSSVFGREYVVVYSRHQDSAKEGTTLLLDDGTPVVIMPQAWMGKIGDSLYKEALLEHELAHVNQHLLGRFRKKPDQKPIEAFYQLMLLELEANKLSTPFWHGHLAAGQAGYNTQVAVTAEQYTVLNSVTRALHEGFSGGFGIPSLEFLVNMQLIQEHLAGVLTTMGTSVETVRWATNYMPHWVATAKAPHLATPETLTQWLQQHVPDSMKPIAQ